MINTDPEMKATQERITYFQSLLAQLRITATREEFPLVAGGYHTEIENMQREVMEYLTRHADEGAVSAKGK